MAFKMQCREETFVQGFKVLNFRVQRKCYFLVPDVPSVLADGAWVVAQESRKAADAARKLESKLADSDESMSLAQDLHLWTHQKLVLAVKLYRVMRVHIPSNMSPTPYACDVIRGCESCRFPSRSQSLAGRKFCI